MGLKVRLLHIVKYSKGIYKAYYILGTLALKIVSIFIKTDNNLILFTSFGGRKYDDSPKVLYEEMLKDERFKKYKLVWGFQNPNVHDIPKGIKINTDTISYFLTALKAKCWITNSSIERGLTFKQKKTFYFNTWHGVPIKKMGTDIAENSSSFKKLGKSDIDVMCAQGAYDRDIFSRVFRIDTEKFLVSGLPRNDILNNYTVDEVLNIKQKLSLPIDKKLILYAPTFREYDKDANKRCVIEPPINWKNWEKVLGNTYHIMFRAHYEVSKVMNIENNAFVSDYSTYENLNELMMVSDILLSDYSSIFFDFSIMHKPMLHYTYDYEEYAKNRGMYFDIRNELHGADNEQELLCILTTLDVEEEKKKVDKFKCKYVEEYGNASKQALDCIYRNIS